MNIVFFTSNRLLADSLTAGLRGRAGISTVKAVDSFSALREILATARLDLVLFDVTPGIDWDKVRSLAGDYPHLALLALGPKEQRHEVVRRGRDVFLDYIARNTTIEELCSAMSAAVQEWLAYSPESRVRSSGRFFASIPSFTNPFRTKASRDTEKK